MQALVTLRMSHSIQEYFVTINTAAKNCVVQTTTSWLLSISTMHSLMSSKTLHQILHHSEERGTTSGMLKPGTKFLGLLDNRFLLLASHSW